MSKFSIGLKSHAAVTLLALGFLLLCPAEGGASPSPQQAANDLELSLERALRLALENNLDIRVIDYDRAVAREAIVTAGGAFDPSFALGTPGGRATTGGVAGGFGTTAVFDGIGYSNSKTATSSSLAGAALSKSDAYSTDFQFEQQLDFGLSYAIGYNFGRNTTNSLFTNLNPSWDNNLGLAVAQPLLKGRGREATGAQVRLARANANVSEQTFRGQVNAILFNVVDAYWELVFAERNLEVAEQSLALAREQLERTQAQVEVGMIAPVEETQAELAVAQRNNDLIVARNGLRNTADNLRALLRADTLSHGWDTQIVASEVPEFEIETFEIGEAIATAIDNRPELATARARIAARRVEVNSASNALLPSLDIAANLTLNGIGGTRLLTEGFPPVAVGTLPGGYGDALGQLGGLDFRAWSIGANFRYNLGNNTAKGNYATAALNEDKARSELQRVEQQTILEVRQAVRAVADAGELVTTTRLTRELAEQQLAIEQDRFDVGMSTNFEVLQFQDDLSRAQVQELRSMIDYRKARAGLARATGAITMLYGIEIQ